MSVFTNLSSSGRKLFANLSSSGPKRGVLIGGVALAVVLGVAYLAGYLLTGDRVPRGTSVSGVEIGGLSPSAAQDKLDEELAAQVEAPIVLRHEDERFSVDPADAGLTLDVEETVLNAGGGHSWNPVRMIELLTGPDQEVQPVVEVDQEALDAEIDRIAERVDHPATEPTVAYTRKGGLDVTEPETGVHVDREATATVITDAFLAEREARPLPVTTVDPEITQDELDTMIAKVAEPAVSAPITLELPSGPERLPVRDFAPALSLSIESGRLVPSIDDTELARSMADFLDRVGREPKDATVVLRGGEPVVVPGAPGVTLDPKEVADAILPVLTETGDARSVEVGTVTEKPDFNTADARALGIKERVSSFVTYYPHAEYRNINQGRAAELINGTVLRPGEIFSFNDTVGERTEENGFVAGTIISNGVYAEDLGGGVSQVVTTTYNAAFFAGLKDIEHKPHSFYIDRYPIGREATVAWPVVDLKFQNDTPYGVLIRAWVVPSTAYSQGEMHVEMWSTKYWDIEAGVSDRYAVTAPATRYNTADDCVATTGYSGFKVDVYRYFRKPGSDEVVKKETQTATYTPADTVICGAPRGGQPD